MIEADERTCRMMMILGALFVIQHPIHEDYEYVRKCIEMNWHDQVHLLSEVRWLSICDALKKSPEVPEEVREEAEWHLNASHEMRRAFHGFGES